MKGYELIVFANAILFAVIGSLALLNGTLIARQADACTSGNATQCERDRTVADTTLKVSPYLFVVAVLLAAVGVGLVLWRRSRELPEADRGGGSP